MTLRIDDFKTALSGGGARANLFRCTVYWPNADIQGDANLNIGGEALHSFMIKQVQMPGSTIGMIPVYFRGRQLKVTGDRTFEDITMTVTNDNNFAVRNAFERWHDAINGNASNQSGRGINATNFNSYVATMEIEQLGRDGSVVKRYRLIGAWPMNVDPIDVSYDSTDEIETFGVTMTCQWWESDTVEDPSTGGFVTPPTPAPGG